MICALAKANNVHVTKSLNGYSHKLSLMPGSIKDHGTDYRNLNDLSFRFKNKKAPVKYIWGYTLEDEKISFIHNCVLSDPQFFKDIMIHEIFHSISMYSGSYRTWNNEEQMAEKFVKYVMERS